MLVHLARMFAKLFRKMRARKAIAFNPRLFSVQYLFFGFALLLYVLYLVEIDVVCCSCALIQMLCVYTCMCSEFIIFSFYFFCK